MKTKSLLAAGLGLALLGTGCATIPRPPGVDGSEYRDWRVAEYRRGHLRPVEEAQQRMLQQAVLQAFYRDFGSCPPGSYCAGPSHPSYADYNNGRHRVVEDPTGHLNRGQERAY